MNLVPAEPYTAIDPETYAVTIVKDTPDFVIDLMHRSEYVFGEWTTYDDYAAGYTILIHKRNPEEDFRILNREVTKMLKWVHKVWKSPTAVLQRPTRQELADQFVVVTIYDCAMMRIEKHIPRP